MANFVECPTSKIATVILRYLEREYRLVWTTPNMISTRTHYTIPEVIMGLQLLAQEGKLLVSTCRHNNSETISFASSTFSLNHYDKAGRTVYSSKFIREQNTEWWNKMADNCLENKSQDLARQIFEILSGDSPWQTVTALARIAKVTNTEIVNSLRLLAAQQIQTGGERIVVKDINKPICFARANRAKDDLVTIDGKLRQDRFIQSHDFKTDFWDRVLEIAQQNNRSIVLPDKFLAKKILAILDNPKKDEWRTVSSLAQETQKEITSVVGALSHLALDDRLYVKNSDTPCYFGSKQRLKEKCEWQDKRSIRDAHDLSWWNYAIEIANDSERNTMISVLKATPGEITNNIWQILVDEKATYKFRSIHGLAEDLNITVQEAAQGIQKLTAEGNLVAQNLVARPVLFSAATRHKDDQKYSTEELRKKDADWWKNVIDDAETRFKEANKPVVGFAGGTTKTPDKAQTDKLFAFFKDLNTVMKKHNAFIAGCNCCGSPYGKVGDQVFEHLRIDREGFAAKVGSMEYTGYTNVINGAKKIIAPPEGINPGKLIISEVTVNLADNTNLLNVEDIEHFLQSHKKIVEGHFNYRGATKAIESLVDFHWIYCESHNYAGGKIAYSLMPFNDKIIGEKSPSYQVLTVNLSQTSKGKYDLFTVVSGTNKLAIFDSTKRQHDEELVKAMTRRLIAKENTNAVITP